MAGNNRRYIRSKAKEWQLGESETGSPFIMVSFPVKNEDGTERFLAWRGYFTEKTTERTIESLRFMGFEGDDLTNLVGLDTLEVDLVVEDEEYEGKTYERVQFINKPRGPAVKKPLEGQKLGAFAAQMKAAFRAHDAEQGKRTGAAPKPAAPRPSPSRTGGVMSPEPPPHTDDDLPF